MKKTIIILGMCIIAFTCIRDSQASILYKLTFDNATAGNISGNYIPGPGEIVLSGSTIIPYNTGSGSGAIVPTNSIPSPSFQGGMALSLDGDTGSHGYYVSMSSAVPPGSLTIEYIARIPVINPPGNTAQIGTVGDTEWPFAPGFNWMLRTLPGGKFNFNTDKEGAGSSIITPTAFETTKWHHIAGIFSYNTTTPASSSISMYIDGTLIGSSTYNAASISYSLGNISNLGNGNTWSIGWGHSNSANGADQRGLVGQIDAVAISDQALTPTQFVLNTTVAPVSVTPKTVSLLLGSSTTITATVGPEPITWSLSNATTGSIDTTIGLSVIFTASSTVTGLVNLIATDSTGAQDTTAITVVATFTSAPLAVDADRGVIIHSENSIKIPEMENGIKPTESR